MSAWLMRPEVLCPMSHHDPTTAADSAEPRRASMVTVSPAPVVSVMKDVRTRDHCLEERRIAVNRPYPERLGDRSCW